MLDMNEMVEPETLIENARIFATAAHGALGQTRKYTGKPYIVHPAAVYACLKYEFAISDPNLLAAAWLHDVVEDTKIGIELIKNMFNTKVAEYVLGATNVSVSNTPRSVQVLANVTHIESQCREVKLLKFADYLCNCRDLVDEDPKYAPKYIKEKLYAVDTFTGVGSNTKNYVKGELNLLLKDCFSNLIN